jgi:hypothetical protein
MRVKNSAFIFGWITFVALLVSSGVQAPSENQDRRPSAAELIKRSLDEKGIQAAKEEFAQILKKKGRYVFEESEFMALGNDYLKNQKPSLAAAVFEMAVEAFPDSIPALRLLAHSYYMLGDDERSLKTQAKMISARGKAELSEFLDKNKDSLAKTAEEVIDRCLEATGGREAWEAVKTAVLVFSVQSTSGTQARMVRMYKRPYLYRQGLAGAPDFTATDGTRIWRVQGGQWQETGYMTFRSASLDNWLLDYKGFGISYEFKGFDHINGSPVYHLSRTYRDGFAEDLYFSATSNLLTEIWSDYVQGMPFMKSFISYWNYRDVDGLKVPFVFIRNMGSLEPPHGGVVEEVRINVPLEDGLFLPPDYKK